MRVLSLAALLIGLILSCCQESETAPAKEMNSDTSEITCPNCGHQEDEKLPTTSCLIVYDCKKCGNTLRPLGEDCCVFCSHGTHKCPSIQEQSN